MVELSEAYGGAASPAPAISVVIPVYNTEKYLERCLDSVMGQTCSDMEVICIDDGSSDGSGRILDERAASDRRMKVLHRDNAGASASRNIGLDIACGEYVLFVDSDDYIEAHACETLLEAARDSRADIVVFGGRTFPSVEWIDRCLATRDVVYADDSYNALLEESGSYPLMCNKFYRRAFLEDNALRFNEELVLGEDNAFQFLAFPCAKNVAFISSSLYHYRCEREGSAIASLYGDLLGKIEKHFAVVSFVAREWKKRGYISGHKARFLDWILFFLFDDAKNLSFADRVDLGGRLGRLLSECGLAASDCSPAMSDIASFMLCDAGGLGDPGRDVAVTVFLRASDCSESSLKEGFLHLANQSEQRLEFFIVGDDSEELQAYRRILGSDPRVAVEERIDDAIRHARGRYAIFANVENEYDWDALALSLKSVDEEGVSPDVVIMRDALGKLRMIDVFRQVVPIGASRAESSADAPCKHFALHLKDLGDLVLSFSSLDACNKLWSLDFVKSHPCFGWDASQVASLMLEADIAVVHRAILCEKKPAAVSAVDEMAETLGELVRLKGLLEEEGSCDLAKRVNGLILSTGVRIVESASTLDSSREASRLLLACVENQGSLIDLPDSLYAAEEDYKTVLLLLGADSLDEALFAHLAMARNRDGGYIQSLEARLEEREEELACVYGSLSFKVGRKVTLIPRKIRDAISRR